MKNVHLSISVGGMWLHAVVPGVSATGGILLGNNDPDLGASAKRGVKYVMQGMGLIVTNWRDKIDTADGWARFACTLGTGREVTVAAKLTDEGSIKLP